jgi:hypothetical protein
MRQYRSVLTGLLLIAVAWGLYLPSLWYGFVHFDDVRILKDHPELYGQADLSQDFRAIFVTSFPREEPLLLRDVSWAIDSRLFGFGNPIGYHLGNVLLHGLVVGLLFALLLKTTQCYSLALATAAAWLLLAVHTEPVAWIMGRKDVLSTLFMLLALYAQTLRLSAKSRGSWCFWYIATIALVLCGLLSKVSVLTFPLVLVLHVMFLPYLRTDRPANVSLMSLLALAREAILSLPNFVASAVIYLWYSRTLTQIGLFDRGYLAHGLGHFWNLLMIDPLALWVYLKQIFLPSCFTVLYTWPNLQAAYSLWQAIGAMATVALVVAAGIWLFRNRKDLFFYYTAFFVLMVPYLNLAYIGIWVADRYIYFAALFPLIIAISIAGEALRRPQTMVRIAAVTVAAVVAGDNIFQKLSYQPAWRDAETLWQYHVALPRPAPEAFGNLAAYYYSVASSHQDTPEADLAMRKMSVVIEAGLDRFWHERELPPPSQVWYLFFLQSIVHEVQGRPKEALASLLLADQLRPGFDAINLNLARLYFRLAETIPDVPQRKGYAHNAQKRFVAYIQLAFRGRTPPADVLREKMRIEADNQFFTNEATGRAMDSARVASPN